MSSLELLNPPKVNYKNFEVAKNFTEREDMSFFLIYHNLTGSVINQDFWWRDLVSDHADDKISLPDIIIMIILSPLMLIILFVALGSYCYKKTVRYTTATVGRLGFIKNIRDSSPNKILAI